ncbi:MAG: hypothetical protein ABJH04_06150 [Cyclobacteriaceae bacterium]
MKGIIEKQSDEDWLQTNTMDEFGTKTKAEALGRIISHTAPDSYRDAGQLSLTLKYGS